MKKEMEDCKYKNLSLEMADNGHKVCYYEKSESKGSISFQHMESSRKEFVFGEKDFSKAIAKYKEISDCILSYEKHESKEGY